MTMDQAPGKNARRARLLSYARPHWKQLAGAVLLGAAVCACQLTMPWIVRVLIDDALAGRRAVLLAMLAGLLAASALGTGAFQYAQRIVFAHLSGHALANIQRDLARHLQTLPVRYRMDKQGGDIASLFLSDAASVARLYEFVIAEAFVNILTFTISLTLMAMLYERLALVALAAAPIYLVPVLPLSRAIRRAAHDAQQAVARMTARLQESVDARREIKAFHREDYDLARLAQGFAGVRRPRVRLIALQGGSSVSFVAFWSLLSLLYWMGGMAVIENRMSLGLLGALITYTMFLRDPFARATGIHNELQTALGAADRMFEFLETPPDPRIEGRRVLRECAGRVQFEGVWFAYPDGPQVLCDVTFHAAAGEMLAVVGPSGSGKSTLVSLVLSLFEPVRGTIWIDQTALRDLKPESVRDRIGVVFQDPFLFSGTVLDNIRFGDPEASDEAVECAAEVAYAGEFIAALPQRYDTVIGERGVKLSGGQRQRIAIARAVLRQPAILILDEATSSLDSQTEAEVLRRLRRQRAGRTTIMVAHRFSTALTADRIIVLHEGRVAGAGTHGQLLERCRLYSDLYSMGGRSMAVMCTGT